MTSSQNVHDEPMPRRFRLIAACAALFVVTVAGCGEDDGDDGGDADEGPSTTPPTGSASLESPSSTETPGDTDELDEAVNQTREDTVYPHVGDPLVDALHYELS